MNGLTRCQRPITAEQYVIKSDNARVGQVTCNCKLDQKGRGRQYDRRTRHCRLRHTLELVYLKSYHRTTRHTQRLFDESFRNVQSLKMPLTENSSFPWIHISLLDFDQRDILRNNRRNHEQCDLHLKKCKQVWWTKRMIYCLFINAREKSQIQFCSEIAFGCFLIIFSVGIESSMYINSLILYSWNKP